MPWLVLSHLFHSVPTPTQASATAAQTHLCLSLSLCGAEIIEPSSRSCGERNPWLRSFSGLRANECKQWLFAAPSMRPPAPGRVWQDFVLSLELEGARQASCLVCGGWCGLISLAPGPLCQAT